MKDTIVHIKDVDIVAKSDAVKAADRGDIFSTSNLVDDLLKGRGVSDVLSEADGVFIKSYGVGQLSSISVNGASAAQTTVTWNGIKINSPTTGLVDFSLFDVSSTDKIYVVPMGTESSIGGKVKFETQALDRNSIFKSDNLIRYGSFNTLSLSTNNSYRFNNFTGNTRLGYMSSDNDFPFRDYTTIGAPIHKEVNAAIKQFSFLQGLKYDFNPNISAGIDFWMTDADRQLPPVMTSETAAQRQYDQAYRTVAYIKAKRKQWDISFASGYVFEKLRYTDPYASIDSRYSAHAFRNNLTITYLLKEKISFEIQPSFDFEKAFSTGYSDIKSRNKEGLGVSVAYEYLPYSQIKLSMRQEILDARSLPFAPTLSWHYCRPVNNHRFTLGFALARAYRVPDMNDLYWSGGGNPNLRTEHSWNSMGKFTYGYKGIIQFFAAGFCNYVTDWILWHPPADGGNWRADNVKRVLSRGANLSVRLNQEKHLKKGDMKFSLVIGYSYTKTTSLDTITGSDHSGGKQLIYVPLHHVNATAQLQFYNFFVNFSNGYISQRYSTTDNSIAIAGYYTAHLELGKNFLFNKNLMGLSFRINNLTNTQYQVVELLPMPGRNYEVTIRLNILK